MCLLRVSALGWVFSHKALIRRFFCVSCHVDSHGSNLNMSLCTNATLVRLLPCVFPRMFLLVIFSNESLLAPSAGELLLRSIFSGGIFLLCVLSCG